MEKFKFSLAIIALIFLLPNSSGEVSITANGESRILFVDSGEKVTFTAKDIENATSILWDFVIDINGPNTRYSNLTEIDGSHPDVIYTILSANNTIYDQKIMQQPGFVGGIFVLLFFPGKSSFFLASVSSCESLHLHSLAVPSSCSSYFIFS